MMWHLNWNNVVLNDSILFFYVFKQFYFSTLKFFFKKGFILVHQVCEMLHFGSSSYIWCQGLVRDEYTDGVTYLRPCPWGLCSIPVG